MHNGTDAAATPRIVEEVGIGEQIIVGGVALTVASLGTPNDEDAVVIEATAARGRKIREGDDGSILVEPAGR